MGELKKKEIWPLTVPSLLLLGGLCKTEGKTEERGIEQGGERERKIKMQRLRCRMKTILVALHRKVIRHIHVLLKEYSSS